MSWSMIGSAAARPDSGAGTSTVTVCVAETLVSSSAISMVTV